MQRTIPRALLLHLVRVWNLPQDAGSLQPFEQELLVLVEVVSLGVRHWGSKSGNKEQSSCL